MPIRQSQMTSEQIAAVAAAMFDAIGETHQVVAGTVRHSRGGAPWGNFGGPNWYRLMDVPLDGETADGRMVACVMDDDGRPLGNPERGPLVISWYRGRGAWHPVAVTVNTGYNLEQEIVWQ